MHTTTKGALAAGTAAVLLLGGAGSLAYWNATGTVGAGTITAGDLQLDASSCTTAGWTVSNTIEGVSNQPFTIASEKVVPGDVLKKTCTVVITAVGKDLRANLDVTNGTATGSSMSTNDYTVGSAFTLNGNPLTSITSANTGQSINATITVSFPIRGVVDNASKTKSVVLTDYTVTATQATS